jgi:hypothetical protein
VIRVTEVLGRDSRRPKRYRVAVQNGNHRVDASGRWGLTSSGSHPDPTRGRLGVARPVPVFLSAAWRPHPPCRRPVPATEETLDVGDKTDRPIGRRPETTPGAALSGIHRRYQASHTFVPSYTLGCSNREGCQAKMSASARLGSRSLNSGLESNYEYVPGLVTRCNFPPRLALNLSVYSASRAPLPPNSGWVIRCHIPSTASTWTSSKRPNQDTPAS